MNRARMIAVLAVGTFAAALITARESRAQPVSDTAVSPQKPLAILDRHQAGVTAVKFSPDGSLLASADLGGKIILWRTATWSVLRTLDHGAELYGIAFSPDGRMLASTGGGRTVAIWDVTTARRTRRISFDRRALAISFAPDGTLLAGTEDGQLHFLSAATGKAIRVLKTGGPVWAVAVSADGKTLATSLPIRVWDYATLAPRGRPRALGQLGLAFSADGTRLASAESTGGAVLWKIADSVTSIPLRLIVQRRASGPRGREAFDVNMPAASIDLSRDGLRAVAGGTTSDLYLWSFRPGDSDAGVPIRLAGHTMTVAAVALSPNRELIASGSLDRTVRVWQWQRR